MVRDFVCWDAFATVGGAETIRAEEAAADRPRLSTLLRLARLIAHWPRCGQPRPSVEWSRLVLQTVSMKRDASQREGLILDAFAGSGTR